jgi:hypothetical protein
MTLVAGLGLLLGGCAYLDTPEERRAVFIGAVGTVVVGAVANELNDDESERSCPAGYLCITDPPQTGPNSPL